MKVLRDTWLVFGRYFGIFIHNPVWVALGVLQPLLYLILFAPLLKPIAAMRGFPPGGAYNVFVPGLLVQLGMFGAAGVGFSLIAELFGMIANRTWAMRDYVKGFEFSPIRFTGEVDLYPMWIEA